MGRKEEQAELLYKLGLLVKPLLGIVQDPENCDPSSRSRASAEFFADFPQFTIAVESFARGEAGHVYDRERTLIMRALNRLAEGAREHLDDPGTLAGIIEKEGSTVRAEILRIPTSVSSQVHEAYTRFATYCTIKDLCQTVNERLVWVDGYMAGSLFYQYLRELPSHVKVLLVTWPEAERKSPAAWRDFLEVSRLYARERGPANYRLVVTEGCHDRWLRCDDQVYHLGSSVKDAAKKAPFTVSRLESTEDAFDAMETLLNRGEELFGPGNASHP